MKKNLLWIAAFTLLLTGCQKSKVIENIDDGDNQLRFGVYQGKATKASELTNAVLNTPGVKFPLYAYKGKQDGAKTEYFKDTLTFGRPVGGEWNTSIPRFLAGNDPLQFYAFYPSDGIQPTDYVYANFADMNSFPTLTYTIQGTGENKGATTDLVAATINDNTGNTVRVPFKHILSQINFGVKGYYGAKIHIKDIKINNVNSVGTYTFDPNAATSWTMATPSASEDYGYKFAGGLTAAASTYATPGQDATTADKESDYTYVFGDGGNWGPGVGATAGDIWYVRTATTATQGSDIADPTANKLSNSLMLMPQELGVGTGTTDPAFVTFQYKICDLGTPAAWIVGGAGDTPTDWEEGKFDLNMSTGATENQDYHSRWDPNLRYLYIIDFKGFLDGLKLTFDVDVNSQPWENYNPNDGNDGIVYLSSLDGTVFRTGIQGLPNNAGTYSIPVGHLFSNITWDWSPYAMTNSFTPAQSFTVTFADVKFNGNKLTIKPPFGFKVSSDGGNTLVTSIDVSATNTTLTFKPETIAYYANAANLNAAIAADGNYTFNASNGIKLTDLASSTARITTQGNKITLHFVAPYGNTVPAGWELSNERRTATFTKK